MKSRYFKLYRAFSLSFNSSNVAFSFCSWILKDCIIVPEKKTKVVVLCSRPQKKKKKKNREIWHFHDVWSCSDGKETYKKAWCTSRLFFFANLNLLLFYRSRWRCRHLCLSSLLSLPDANQISSLLGSPSCCCRGFCCYNDLFIYSFFIYRIIFLCWPSTSFIWW